MGLNIAIMSSWLGFSVVYRGFGSFRLFFIVYFGNFKVTIRFKVDYMFVIFIKSIVSCVFNVLRKKEKKI